MKILLQCVTTCNLPTKIVQNSVLQSITKICCNLIVCFQTLQKSQCSSRNSEFEVPVFGMLVPQYDVISGGASRIVSFFPEK